MMSLFLAPADDSVRMVAYSSNAAVRVARERQWKSGA